MPRGINNWNYKQVEKFLINNNFRHIKSNGSHNYFVGTIDNIPRVVTVPFHGKKSIPNGTMKSIIIQSGILKDKWFEK